MAVEQYDVAFNFENSKKFRRGISSTAGETAVRATCQNEKQ